MSIAEVIEPRSSSLGDAGLRGPLRGEPSGHVSRKHSREKEQTSPSLTEMSRMKDLLPPTPETMTPVPSEGRNISTPSIVAEKLLLDEFPTPAKDFSDVLPTKLPRTAETLSSLNDSQAYMDPTDVGLSDSDDDKQSTRAEQSEDEDEAAQEYLPQATTFMGGFTRGMQGSGSKYSSRVLKPYGMDMMFNGEGIRDEYLPRASSHLFPTSAHRRQSVQYPLPEHRPTVSRIETTPAQTSPKVKRSSSSATADPSRRARHDRAVTMSLSHEEYEAPKLENPRVAPIANPANPKSFVSRMFRRSSPRTASSLADTDPHTTSLEPPSTHANSSIAGTRPIRPGPASTYNPNTRSPSAYNDHSTSTTSSKTVRPETAASLDASHPSWTHQPRRQAGRYHDNTSSSGERINTPGTEHSDPVGYSGQENLAVRGREGTRPEWHEAVRDSSDEERRSAAAGRNRAARGSVDEGAADGSKWVRRASLRVREGLGRRKAER